MPSQPPQIWGYGVKNHKLSVVYSTIDNNQGKKHTGLIRLTNEVYETEYFTDTIMLEHLLQLPKGDMNM